MHEYTAPEVLTTGITEGWAEPITDPTVIDWPARQAAAALGFEVRDGRPVNRYERTAVQRGRNHLGRWGENLMADAIVTCTYWHVPMLLMVERGDGLGWAVPGGSVDPGETPAAASARELAEETGLTVPADCWSPGEPRYVPDPRASDEAWAVTVPAVADLGDVAELPDVVGADDAKRAEWICARNYQQVTNDLDLTFDGIVFPAHVDMLRDVLGTC